MKHKGSFQKQQHQCTILFACREIIDKIRDSARLSIGTVALAMIISRIHICQKRSSSDQNILKLTINSETIRRLGVSSVSL